MQSIFLPSFPDQTGTRPDKQTDNEKGKIAGIIFGLRANIWGQLFYKLLFKAVILVIQT
jgi:hypothetical protein